MKEFSVDDGRISWKTFKGIIENVEEVLRVGTNYEEFRFKMKYCFEINLWVKYSKSNKSFRHNIVGAFIEQHNLKKR